MDRFELQKLRELPIEAVAERLGLCVSRHKCLCPFHDDHHASMSFHIGRNTFRCFVCDAKGGTIDLVMKYLNKDFVEACRWLADEHNIIHADESSKFQVSGFKSEPKPFDATRYERYFERPWLSSEAQKFLFEERRLDPRVVRWCRLTSWRDKQGVPWLQIPYYNREGKLVGVQNRNLTPSLPLPSVANEDSLPFVGPKAHSVLSLKAPVARGEAKKTPSLGRAGEGSAPRFRFPQGSQCGIYNLPVLNRLKPGDELWITEGCSDCWAMLSSGRKAIAIPSATLLSQKDVELLTSLPSSEGSGEGLSFHMFPDRDAPGERLFLQLQKVLPNLVHHQLPMGCKDFGEYYSSLREGELKKGS